MKTEAPNIHQHVEQQKCVCAREEEKTKYLLGNEVHATLALLLLELQRHTANGTTLNTLHQVLLEQEGPFNQIKFVKINAYSDVAGDFVADALRGQNGNFLGDLLVRIEVECETA